MLSIIKKLKSGGKGEKAYGNNLTIYWKKWLKTKYTHTWLDSGFEITKKIVHYFRTIFNTISNPS